MTKINTTASAIDLFEQSAIQHTDATQIGDYKNANKSYKTIVISTDFLKKHNEIEMLMPFLSHSNKGVTVWAASYLLSKQERVAKEVLAEISRETSIIAFNAKMVIQEWENGNLKL